ncbi:MAG TPA: MdtA/MuxA family multidrug efflux RND transporter periplasmic adaptor subunit [Candidatus Binataceae bacterium]|nr:MdtA/MuxA family multidrug efflux RND transporter periplasmic adaptor subunit [Candidatus Binataceae bacterium]
MSSNASITDTDRPNTVRYAQELGLGNRIKSSTRHWWFWAGALVLLVVVYRIVAGIGRERAQSAEAAAAVRNLSVPVQATGAKRGDLDLYLNEIGTVTPFQTVTIHTRVDGELIRVLFKEGQIVKDGDLLAEIDPRPYQVQLTQAEGQMARDKASLINARSQLARYKELYAQNILARQDLDSQQALAGQYDGSVKNDQGLIDSANLNLVYCKITSPLNGRVGLRLVDPGNIVHAADAGGLMVITQIQPIAVIFSIPEDDLPRVIDAMKATPQLPVDAYDRSLKTKLATGTLLTLDNEIDQSTGTVKLKASFPNQDNALFPNQFVNAKLLVDTKRNAVLIPTAGLQRSSQGAFVYVIKPDQTVEMRMVTVAASQGDLTAIASGVNPGELVVVDGTDKLRQGTKVSVQLAANPITPGATQ